MAFLHRFKLWLSDLPRVLVQNLGAPRLALVRLFQSLLHPRRLICIVAVFLLFYSGIGITGWWLLFHTPGREPWYPSWDRQRVRPVMLDADGRLIGMMPARSGAPYTASAPAVVPAHWWRMLVLLEDANRDRWYHWLGVDWSQLPKRLVRSLLGRPNSGGSTLEMQLVKTLHTDTDVKGLWRYMRKARDFLFAPVVSLAFDETELARWVAAHFPFTTSGPHGLEAASWLLFGRPAAELDLARQAVLAAAVKYRVDINAYDETGWHRARSRWRRLIARAELGLDRLQAAGGIDARAHAEAVQTLHELALPDLVPPPALRAWSSGGCATATSRRASWTHAPSFWPGVSSSKPGPNWCSASGKTGQRKWPWCSLLSIATPTAVPNGPCRRRPRPGCSASA